jgi:hypothetical protein
MLALHQESSRNSSEPCDGTSSAKAKIDFPAPRCPTQPRKRLPCPVGAPARLVVPPLSLLPVQARAAQHVERETLDEDNGLLRPGVYFVG